MGNCIALPAAPRCLGAAAAAISRSSSSSSSSSSRSCSSFSCGSDSHLSFCGSFSTTRTAESESLQQPPERILPFPTTRDLSADYKLGTVLGEGQFGVIRLCTCLSSGMLFACKSISKSRMLHNLPDILREVRVMQRLSVGCPGENASAVNPSYAVRLHQVIEDNSHVHLIMELCRGGELFEHIVKKKRFSEADAACIIKDLMQTVLFCHRMGVIHRDIKPENILLAEESDKSSIRLADFGLALEFSPGNKFSGLAGSAYYIAPEVLKGDYSEEVDVWSTGVVLYVMLCGEPPFWGDNEESIFTAIREANLQFTDSIWKSISFSAKDLIKRMLCVDPKLRLTPAQILEHPWILHHCRVSTPEKDSNEQRQKVRRSTKRMANVSTNISHFVAQAA